MYDENTFRWILLSGFVVLTAMGLWYRIRARTHECLDRRQEGVAILIGLRLVALLCFGLIIAYMIKPGWLAWSAVQLPAWARWLGVVLAGFSLATKVWTFHCLGTNLTDTVVTRQQHVLVTSGPYRWVRHPFYTSFAMDVVGVSLLTANWLIFLSGFIAFLFIMARTGIEEQKLLERFGDDYRSYMARTGRFLPWLDV